MSMRARRTLPISKNLFVVNPNGRDFIWPMLRVIKRFVAVQSAQDNTTQLSL
jgi:hypothetical protein